MEGEGGQRNTIGAIGEFILFGTLDDGKDGRKGGWKE
jgi:hypothetical protein